MEFFILSLLSSVTSTSARITCWACWFFALRSALFFLATYKFYNTTGNTLLFWGALLLISKFVQMSPPSRLLASNFALALLLRPVFHRIMHQLIVRSIWYFKRFDDTWRRSFCVHSIIWLLWCINDTLFGLFYIYTAFIFIVARYSCNKTIIIILWRDKVLLTFISC